MRSRYAVALLVACASACGLACTPPGQIAEGYDENRLPANVRADYELFAQRCSKCHSLARPLESGITDDEFWHRYVERMRHQPGSGISPSDEPGILRFLHYYSVETLKHRSGGA